MGGNYVHSCAHTYGPNLLALGPWQQPQQAEEQAEKQVEEQAVVGELST